jgi:Uma2 family endonuclease
MTTTRVMTAEELLALPDDGLRRELVKGELRSMSPMGDEHGDITMELAWWLSQHVRARRLGKVYAAETGFVLARNPDTVRAADVAFVRREHLTPRQRRFREIAPDLVAEVISPTDRPREVVEKVQDWLAAGTRMVLVVDPPRRTVAVHRPDAPPVVLTEADTLEGGDVVPGWSLPVHVLFAEEDEPS